MRGFIDLHCHWIVSIDDGVRTAEESYALLSGLHEVGFDHVVATPHMRPGMFDNTRRELEDAYRETRASLEGRPGLPRLSLSSEHFFDDVVFERFMRDDVLPYPGGKAALVEFDPRGFPTHLEHRFFDLMRRGIRPVIAHPERYTPVWKSVQSLDKYLDVGAVLLLDVAALSGKYGRSAQRASEQLVREGYYYAACTDSHAPADVADVRRGIAALAELAGDDEVEFLFVEGPTHILEGRVED
ncbi:MAG: CpsB/CapC family capsule biosynthesis tyrosine phosphatase [Polyangiaceae bacterium]